MAGSLNKVMLIGNLGADPEVRHFDDGGSLARLRIATSESYTDREGNRVENTEWHTVILRRGLAGVAEKYLKKGDKIFIEGSIRTRQWQDDQGNDRYNTEIRAINMTMLGAPGPGSGSANPAPPSAPAAAPVNPAPQGKSGPAPADLGGGEEDDLPF
ncbi:single-stranded DNA-binding protein [Cryomorphaceae bacterium]|nr:single-stranded DNA-binding protein [Cryomorphaceae bacterium]